MEQKVNRQCASSIHSQGRLIFQALNEVGCICAVPRSEEKAVVLVLDRVVETLCAGNNHWDSACKCLQHSISYDG